MTPANAQRATEGLEPRVAENLLDESLPLERPDFAAGQVLTEADLDGLVDWGRRKFRHAARRHGWGVAGGLRLEADQTDRTKLVLTAGVAIDALGREIVVPEDRIYDLGTLLNSMECGTRPDKAVAAWSESRMKPSFAGLPLRGSEIFPVDLVLKYRPLAAAPQPLVARPLGSGDTTGRLYARTRVRQDYLLCPVAIAPSKGTKEAEGFLAEFKRRGQIKTPSIPDPQTDDAAKTQKDQLLAELEDAYNNAFAAAIRGYIEATPNRIEPSSWDHARLLLILARRLALVHHPEIALQADDRGPPEAVAAGRIWISRSRGPASKWELVAADMGEHRRPLSSGLPADTGKVNTAWALGMRVEPARLELARSGIILLEPRLLEPSALDEKLVETLDFQPQASPGEQLVPVVFDFAEEGLGERIVKLERKPKTVIDLIDRVRALEEANIELIDRVRALEEANKVGEEANKGVRIWLVILSTVAIFVLGVIAH